MNTQHECGHEKGFYTQDLFPFQTVLRNRSDPALQLVSNLFSPAELAVRKRGALRRISPERGLHYQMNSARSWMVRAPAIEVVVPKEVEVTLPNP